MINYRIYFMALTDVACTLYFKNNAPDALVRGDINQGDKGLALFIFEIPNLKSDI